MNYTTVIQAIISRLKTSFLTPNSLTAVAEYDNHTLTSKPAITDKNSAWIRASVIPGETVQVQQGNPKTFRMTGALIIQIFTSPTYGSKRASDLATLAANAFRSVSLPEAVFRSPTVNSVGLEPGGWYQWNVTCPFFVTFTG